MEKYKSIELQHIKTYGEDALGDENISFEKRIFNTFGELTVYVSECLEEPVTVGIMYTVIWLRYAKGEYRQQCNYSCSYREMDLKKYATDKLRWEIQYHEKEIDFLKSLEV